MIYILILIQQATPQTVVISFTLPHKYKYIYDTEGQLAEYNYDYSYRIVDKE